MEGKFALAKLDSLHKVCKNWSAVKEVCTLGKRFFTPEPYSLCWWLTSKSVNCWLPFTVKCAWIRPYPDQNIMFLTASSIYVFFFPSLCLVIICSHCLIPWWTYMAGIRCGWWREIYYVSSRSDFLKSSSPLSADDAMLIIPVSICEPGSWFQILCMWLNKPQRDRDGEGSLSALVQ